MTLTEKIRGAMTAEEARRLCRCRNLVLRVQALADRMDEERRKIGGIGYRMDGMPHARGNGGSCVEADTIRKDDAQNRLDDALSKKKEAIDASNEIYDRMIDAQDIAQTGFPGFIYWYYMRAESVADVAKTIGIDDAQIRRYRKITEEIAGQA